MGTCVEIQMTLTAIIGIMSFLTTIFDEESFIRAMAFLLGWFCVGNLILLGYMANILINNGLLVLN